ncbi:hypothetical protein [Limoniibacter endophyticus]|uniref:Uncharacterized protein n=1 Tax=Limoniibacter endophyticus TaxID=1565040 RepID=A0A8J3DIX8_9HYPH|nr:hypothetical protein [Limoniibacter endophyticus]GHC76176.1 hypothetical protein GCM10010136_26630 [Limoniibacter endophyticus]
MLKNMKGNRDTHPAYRVGNLRDSVLRMTLLFGSIAVAMGMLIVPVLYKGDHFYGQGPGIDRMTTSSIEGQPRTYTIRRSVTQHDPGAVCLIYGPQRVGDC